MTTAAPPMDGRRTFAGQLLAADQINGISIV